MRGKSQKENKTITRQIVQEFQAEDNLVRKWEAFISKHSKGKSKETFYEQTEAKSRALRLLASNTEDQKKLIRIAQRCKEILDSPVQTTEDEMMHEYARRLNSRARELFILCHQGFVEKTIAKHVHQFDAESTEEALHVLRQEAWSGIDHGIDKYRFDSEAKPLTYIRSWIRANISAATESEGRLIRLKSKAHDFGKKVQTTVKQLENEGKTVTIEEVAQILEASPNKVAEVMPYATKQVVRLDAPISHSEEGEDTIGSITIDDRTNIEDNAIREDIQNSVRKAVASIQSPLQRTIIEQFYGLNDNEIVEQKDLFDGVYRDKAGNAYSAEPSVISDRRRRGEEVIKKSQKELNRLFADGEMTFEPGTEEAAELARVAKFGDDIDEDAEYSRIITRETGVPPTSGTIQEAKRKAEETMRDSTFLKGLAPQYRGGNELENSEAAREKTRQALLALGAVRKKDLVRLKATRGSQGDKSELRKLAEKHGLVDKKDGKINLTKIDDLIEN